ncbi:MAG: hypothetical protein IJR19_08235, partial [Lachnospiraceae bacterium]|nr:hypothetical protein [Lachnospiraceae bacterium]
VKDFGADTFETSETLMSNADTCAIAMEGIIEKPVNPLNGQSARITPPETDGVIQVSDDREYGELKKRLYEFHDDVRDPENWTVEFSD